MPFPGTPLPAKAAYSHRYGSFGKTHRKTNEFQSNHKNSVIDKDSGMSSEETDDSLKYDANIKNNVSVSSNLNQKEVINKCLTIEPHCAQHRNEIPCCSNDTNIDIVEEDTSRSLDEDDDEETDEVSEFIVIDLTCDVNNVSESKTDGNSCTNCTVECDNLSIHSLGESQSLVPVNNELVRSDSQKLVSLSLSILLAALLQAMRCFAQFLEDIVVPQR